VATTAAIITAAGIKINKTAKAFMPWLQIQLLYFWPSVKCKTTGYE
jgi:hypothetical protein